MPPRRLWILASLFAQSLTVHGEVDFAHDVLPILKTHCAECHTNGTYKGGFSLDTRSTLLESDDVVVIGNSAESEFIALLLESEAEDRMPQKADPLDAPSIATLKAWIDEGLAWEEGFTFKEASWKAPLEPRRPILPIVGALGSHPIDRLLAAYFESHHLSAPEIVGDRPFVRRLFLDLLGILPDPQEVEDFVLDRNPNKRANLIHTLLARDVDYADHWLTFWNDLLRNDYKGTGYIDGGRQQITDWLYRALLTNKPYDEFTRELISPQPESAGFIAGIQWRGNVNASQRREVQFAQNISQVFLGENMKCASCHDSFINDWKLADAYGLAAIIAEQPLEIHRCDKPTGEFATARFLFPSLGTIDTSASKDARLKQTAALMTSPENGRFARTIVNRFWQRLMGRGLVEPADMMGNEPWNPDLLDSMAVEFADDGYDLKQLLTHIVSSRTYQSRCVELHVGPAEAFVFRGPVAKRLTAEQFIDALWKVTGHAPDKPLAKSADTHPRPFVRSSLVASTILMRALGRPNREQVVTVRPETLSTIQALELNNGKEFSQLLQNGAERLSQEFKDTDHDALIHALFQQTLCRPPKHRETETARQLLGTRMTIDGIADLLWSLFMLPEFQLVH